MIVVVTDLLPIVFCKCPEVMKRQAQLLGEQLSDSALARSVGPDKKDGIVGHSSLLLSSLFVLRSRRVVLPVAVNTACSPRHEICFLPILKAARKYRTKNRPARNEQGGL